MQRLDLMKSKASVLSSVGYLCLCFVPFFFDSTEGMMFLCLLTCLVKGATTLGSSFFFLGSRLADSLLVQFSCGMPTSVLPDLTDEVSFMTFLSGCAS